MATSTLANREAGRPRLSTITFIDPHDAADRQHVTIGASQPRPLPREPRLLKAEVPGMSRDLGARVVETDTTSVLVIDWLREQATSPAYPGISLSGPGQGQRQATTEVAS